MDATSFQKVDWYQGITLTERIAVLKNTQFILKTDLELAQRQIDRWKSQAPFDKDSYFAQRLATESISEEEFLNILGEPSETVCDRHPYLPAWLNELAQAFALDPASEPTIFSEVLQETQTLGFLEIIEPLIRQGRDRLRIELLHNDSIKINPSRHDL